MVYNKISVAFGSLRRVTAPAINYQYDVTQVLVIRGLPLPEYYVVDFCNEGDTTVIPITGTSDGVEIPDSLLQTGKPIKAYIVIASGDGDIQTRYEVKIPVTTRPQRQDITPTDPQQQQIDTLVAALNDGVSRAEDAASMLENASADAETLPAGEEATAEYDEGVFRFGIPEGEKGNPFTYEDFTEEQKAELVQGPILEAQTNAVNAVNQAGTTQVNAVNQAGTTKVNAVNLAGTTQVENVNTAGTTQVNAVQAKGEEVIGSIPLDYSDLVDEVSDVEEKIEIAIIDKGYVRENQSYSGFTQYQGYTIASNGNITTSYGSSFTTFQMTADRDFDLYFSSANYTPTKGACFLGANGSRYRNIDNNLPTEQNPIHITAGSVVNIVVYTSGSSFVFWWNNVGYEINPTFISDINENINKPIICKATDPDNVDIYIPSKRTESNCYFDVKLLHAIIADVNCNVWKLDAVYLVQKNGNSFINRVNIISCGEWTCALKIHGASDFMGGNYHGDEIINNAVILIDGTPYSFTAGETLECQSITILENTNLYNPEEQSELAAVVARKINITTDGIETDQRVEWKHAYTMDWSYLGMFCIMRTITDRGYSDTEYIPYDIGVQGFDNPMYVNNANCLKNRKLIGEYGTESKLHFELECTHIKPELPTRPTYIYNGNPYNKIYMSFCPNNYEVAIGDVWEATHIYRMTENIT